MKTRAVAMFCLFFSAALAWAGEPFKGAGDIVGVWELEATAQGLGKVRTDENRTWEFKADGALVTSGFNRVTKKDDQMRFGYKVEGGKLLLIDPGRPNKPQILDVHERDKSSMTLTGGWEGVYYFRRK